MVENSTGKAMKVVVRVNKKNKLFADHFWGTFICNFRVICCCRRKLRLLANVLLLIAVVVSTVLAFNSIQVLYRWVNLDYIETVNYVDEDVVRLPSGNTVNVSILKPFLEPEVPRDIYAVVLVLSAPGNRANRDAIRDTWGRRTNWNCLRLYTNDPSFDYRAVFVLGTTYNESLDKDILEEAKEHQDLLLGDFNDTYKHLLFKTLMGLTWATRGVNSTYIIKTDDDMYLNIPNIFGWLQRLTTPVYAGSVAIGWAPQRDKFNKNYISKKDYPKEVLPSFVTGPFYVLSKDTAVSFLKQAPVVVPLTNEDVYIGLLAQTAGVDAQSAPGLFLDTEGDAMTRQMTLCTVRTMLATGHMLRDATIRKTHFRVMVAHALVELKKGWRCPKKEGDILIKMSRWVTYRSWKNSS